MVTQTKLTNTAASPERLLGPDTIPIEEAGWWEHERAALLAEVFDADTDGRRHIDVGCGWGTVANELVDTGGFVVATDAYRYEAWSRAGARACFVQADADRLPFRDGAFDRCSALDVIEHLPDDRPALRELRRVAAPRASLIVSVPAFAWLWSAHDERVGHYRRYDTDSLREALESTGWTMRWNTNFFAWLVVPAYLFKRSRGRLSGSEGGGLTSRIAHILCSVERRWLRRHRLAVGTSLVARAEPSGPQG